MQDDAPRLFLITPPIDDAAGFAPLLERALGAGDVACVLIRAAARDESGIKAVVKMLAPLVQSAGAAALVEGDYRLAVRTDADGVHADAQADDLAEAIGALQPKKIVGAGNLATRDDAMVAGEAGADYLMFGFPGSSQEGDDVAERIAWWASIFNVPCVGYAARPEEAGLIAEAGAEFVALCDGLWDRPDDIETVMRTAMDALRAARQAVA